MDIEALAAERAERDRFMAEHYASPIPEEHVEAFTGLRWFDPDPAWRLTGAWDPLDSPKVPVPTSSGGEMAYTQLGTVSLEVAAKTYLLAVYDDGDGGPFVPFRDATCGTDSYAGGRYVAVSGLPDEAILDFNRAHNPFCAYDEDFVCPLPPSANWLACAVPAGEMDYRPPS